MESGTQKGDARIDSGPVEKDSIAPAARALTRWWRNPVVRWIGGGMFSIAVAGLSTGIWPFFKGWVITRASEGDVRSVTKDLAKIEMIHPNVTLSEDGRHVIREDVDWRKVQVVGNDPSSLDHGEKVEWAVLQTQRYRLRLIESYRIMTGIEAEVRCGARTLEGRKAARRTAINKYLEFIKTEEPEAAFEHALEASGYDR